MSYKRNCPNSCPLFRKRSFEKVKVNFHVDFAPFLQLSFGFVEFTRFWDLLFR